MTRKKIFNYVARSAMTLFLAVTGITNASASDNYIVCRSAIYVNGTWYYCGTNLGDWCNGGAFNNSNLGVFDKNTPLPLGGQSQTYDYNNNENWGSGTVNMYYRFDNDDNTIQSIDLYYYGYGDGNNNNNKFQSGGGSFATTGVDISGLSYGNHTIDVWFKCGEKYDSNNSSNYSATFTVGKNVSYLLADGITTGQVTANVLTGSENISENNPITEGWYIVEGTVNFNSTLYLKGNVNLILADGCTMNVGTENSSISGIGIDGNYERNDNGEGPNDEFTIYGQSLGSGKINIFASSWGIETYYYDIIINRGFISVTSTNSSSIDICSGNLYFNDGTIIANAAGSGISVGQNIEIKGGSISTTGNMGISAGSTINISGGTVTIDDGKYGREFGLSADNIIIEGGTVTINSDNAEYDHNCGLHADGNIIIKGGTVTVSNNNEPADDKAIYAEGTINIKGGTVVANGCYYGIYSEDGDIIIEGGDITATAIANEDNYGAIYTEGGDINISDGTVHANGGDASIYAFNGNITVSGGEVIVSSDYYGIYTYNSGNIIINGGEVTANCTYSGIRTNSSNSYITINDGNITATATGTNTDSENNHFAIGAKSITINGGEVTAIGTNSDGIYTPNGTLNGGIVNATGGIYGINIKGDGSIVLNGAIVTANSYNGTVAVASGFTYTDEENGSYTGEISENSVLANKTLEPSSYTLTANQPTDEGYAGTYWTTLYFRSLGFKINNNVNACAYTATYDSDNSEITLDKLGEDGKSIPQNTAVIIVSSTPSVSMTADGTLGTFTGSNDLHGVDVSTPTADIISDLGSGTFYLMGQTSGAEGGFGFHKYIGTTMPARKAFLLIDGDGAALARMVFNDATGIKSIDNGIRTIDNESDAWYSLDGRKLSQKPTTKGVYINNGKKILIK